MRRRTFIAAALVLTSACATLRHDTNADREDEAAMMAQAHQRLAAGETAAAARILERVLETDPQADASVCVELGRAHLLLAEPAEARVVVEWAFRRQDGAGHSGAALRKVMRDSYADQGLVSTALDYLDPPNLKSALDHPALAAAVGPLVEAEWLADMGLVDAARERYLGWLGSYGLPDHPLLRAASDRLRATTTSISGAEAVARARAALAVGDAPAALADLALAFRTLPSALFEREAAADFARLAAQAPDLSVTSARAAGLAEQADAALAEHRLADALGAYRAAVVTAPWSADLHRNLAALLAEASRFDDAVLEMDWYLRLAPAGPAVAQARRARASWAASPEEREQRRQVRESRYLGRWRAANSRRSAGIALSVIGGILGGAGGGLFAGLGARTNDQIRAGGFSTGQDLDAVHSLGHRYNQTAVGFAIAGAAITAVGLPLALSSLYVGDADAPEAP